MKNKFSKTKFAILFYSGFVIWGMGFLFLPERIFWDSFQSEAIASQQQTIKSLSMGFDSIVAAAQTANAG